jgi:chemosensory pili system protein ChpA (sensor histidine kinase/response regulator)
MNQLATDSLLWIKGELDGVLVHARQGLEAYVEDPEDRRSLAHCIESLHQIEGTLRVVEVHGAAMLAEEMEAVAKAAYEGTLRATDGAFEALMRAILQLPDYLERVIRGQRDVPLALRPLLNELRVARGEPPFTESAVFAQTIDESQVRLPDLPAAARPETVDLGALASKLRPKFQTALLAWLKDDAAIRPLGKMAWVVGQFEQAAGQPAVFELWWIVGGVIEALHDKGLDTSVELKQILGQIDRQIRRLTKETEAEFAAEPPRELVNNLLYYIGRATSGGERVSNIKQSFNLVEQLPESARIDDVRSSMSGPNEHLMRTVSAAVKEDIVQVKDSLDIFVRTGRGNLEDLAPFAELLKKVGDTLGVLGLGGPRSELTAQIDTLKAAANGEDVGDTELMRVAETLLGVETRLDRDMAELVEAGDETDKRGEAAASERDPEYEQTFATVIRESIVNLARVKEVMTEYTRGEANREAVARVPDYIRQAEAGLKLVTLERPAGALNGVRRFVEQRVLKGHTPPSTDALERMADALVSVEFYLETILSGRGDPQSMLDNAETCIDELGLSETDGEPALSMVEPEAETTAPAAEADSGAHVEKSGAAHRAGPDEVRAEPAADTPAGTAPVDSSAPAVPPADEVDPEILDIFLEEADEELARLNDYFPRWQRNPEDRDALAVVRRSFHTLKGSGRMVGARRIGEFAWAVENMLNRVIDGTVEAGEPIIELVGDVIDALPGLVAELKADGAPKIDVGPFIARAEAFSRNEPAPRSESPAPAGSAADAADVEADSEPEPVAEATPKDRAPAEEVAETPDAVAANGSSEDAEPTETGMDPALYDIFSKEAASHLDTVDAFLAERAEGGAPRVDEPLLRALHTLKGSAHMAGANAVCELVEPAESYLKGLAARQASPSEEGAAVLDDASAAVRRLIADLAVPAATEHDFSDLAGRLSTLAERNVEPVEAPPVEEPDYGAIAHEIESFVEDEAAQAKSAEETDSEPVAGEANETDPEIEPESGAEPEAPTPEPAAPAEGLLETTSSDFDPELASIFFEEARELIEAIDVAMQGWSENERDDSYVVELQRHLHTFKGGARMAGLMVMGDLSHELETLLTHVMDGRAPVSPRLLNAVQQVIDRLHRMLELCMAGKVPAPADDLLHELDWLERRDREEADREAPASNEAPVTDEPAANEEPAADEPVASEGRIAQEPATAPEPDNTVHFRPTPETDRRAAARIQPDLMRVRSDLLEAALNHAGEVGIYRSRLEQQTSTMNFNIAELDQTVNRLREQLRKFEIETEAQIVFQHEQAGGEERGDFDPLELDRYSQMQQLSRSLMESVSDLASIQALLSNQSRQSETLLLQQSRVTTELQDNLMRTRMVPFSNHSQRLRRVVRQAAREANRNAELKFSGAEGEMDRQVLERVLAPLEHMLRNAVVHGIEPEAERKANDKPATGRITIGLHREGAEVVIDIIDDGAGLDLEAIRHQAVEKGLVDADAQLSESDIMQFIFETGFSTAEKITKSAGRGVGMDVVASEVKQLGGSLAIDSVAGAGTKITIRLPFTLAITQALMVSVGEESFAIPLPAIEGIARIPGRDLNRYFAGEETEFTYGGRAWRIRHLSSLLGFPPPPAEENRMTYPVLLVRSGDHFGALVTESMQGSREVVVKSIGPQIASIRGLSGATILGDGSILLILDPAALVRAPLAPAVEETTAERPAEEEHNKVVMVVDDSITVRRVTQRLLERYGIRVETAKDGVDALTKLQDVTPDVMLLDIEMPRMDGYELATNIRNDKRLGELPIIMITSRSGEKHRNRAMEIGVNEYLGKPYQESDLLERIQRLLPSAGTAA